MLFLAMLLQTIPSDPEKSGTPALPRMLDLVSVECIDAAGCSVDPARRYRLDMEAAPGEDAQRSALRGVWQACETTGAPVCPSKGRLILRTAIEPR